MINDSEEHIQELILFNQTTQLMDAVTTNSIGAKLL